VRETTDETNQKDTAEYIEHYPTLLQTYQLCFFGQHGTKKIDDIPDASLG
jgi:hypothetical protein